MDGAIATPLDALHRELGARMTEFAGHALPLQYPAGVMAEHLHTRAGAALFDVSHMGQIVLRGPGGDTGAAAMALEALVCADIAGLAPGRQRYALFTNDAGGIEDDLMVAHRGDHLFLVVNGARRAHDLALLRAGLPAGITIEEHADRALLALQGPRAEAALAGLWPGARALRFMDAAMAHIAGAEVWVTRSGYTGEDGFELSVPAASAEALARALLSHDDVAPAGLGARDSLRLEAGLCLYGQDMDASVSPSEAALDWAIGKARRTGGARAGGFPGAGRILREMAEGPARRRVGLRPEGRAPMRAGTALFAAESGGDQIGQATSGGFGPSLGVPVAMGFVPPALAAPATALWGEVRGRRLAVTVAPLPHVAPRFKR